MPDTRALLDALRRENDPTQQSKLIEEIGRLGDPTAVDTLIRFVLPPDFASGAAIDALGRLGDPRAVPVLIESFRHLNLAWIAKDALLQIGSAAVDALIAALEHAHPDIRFMAVRCLGELNDPRAAGPLQALIDADPDSTNRQMARSTLKTLLLNSLGDSSEAFRLAAVQGLRTLGDARTIEPLQETADADPDPAIREAAEETIVHLLGRVEADPFQEHDLPLYPRETRLSINRLRQVTGQGFQVTELPDQPENAGTTLRALYDIARQSPDLAALASQALEGATLALLRHPHPQARQVAVAALGWLDTGQAARRLHQIAECDPDAAVRQAAGDAAHS